VPFSVHCEIVKTKCSSFEWQLTHPAISPARVWGGKIDPHLCSRGFLRCLNPRCYLPILGGVPSYTCWDQNFRTLPSGVCLAGLLFRSSQIHSGCASFQAPRPLLVLVRCRGLKSPCAQLKQGAHTHTWRILRFRHHHGDGRLHVSQRHAAAVTLCVTQSAMRPDPSSRAAGISRGQGKLPKMRHLITHIHFRVDMSGFNLG